MRAKFAKRVDEVGMKRAVDIVELILPWLINEEGKLLDFGCGLGHLGYLISQKTRRQVEYYDVRKYPYAPNGVEIKVFDGKRLPCGDREFDTALVAFVLHHVPDPLESLREIARVSNRYILLCEDLVSSRGEIYLEAVKDIIVNMFLPHMTLQYRIEKDWEMMFDEMGLKIERKVYFQTKYIFTFKQVAWLLKVPS